MRLTIRDTKVEVGNYVSWSAKSSPSLLWSSNKRVRLLTVPSSVATLHRLMISFPVLLVMSSRLGSSCHDVTPVLPLAPFSTSRLTPSSSSHDSHGSLRAGSLPLVDRRLRFPTNQHIPPKTWPRAFRPRPAYRLVPAARV